MKYTLLNICCTISAIFLCISCEDFLDAELNKSLSTKETIFASDEGATSAMFSVYYDMMSYSKLSGYPEGLFDMAGVGADNLHYYPESGSLYEFETHNIDPENTHVSALWNLMYNLIYQVNAIIEGVNASGSISADTKDQLLGEAKFMRAYFYFYLTELFGDVPLITSTDYNENTSTPRTPREEIDQRILEDLSEALGHLGDDYITSGRIRPNKACAQAMLARVYLFRKDWENAEQKATEVIENPAYHISPVDEAFLKDSEETIWQLKPVIPTYGTPEGYNYILTATPRNTVLTEALIRSFEENDLRLHHWIGTFTGDTGTFYYPYKYKVRTKGDTEEWIEYSKVFRLSEQYLIRAEARVQLGKLDEARADLNVVRNRAEIGKTGEQEPLDLLASIAVERRHELFAEWGHRWLDIKRELSPSGVLTDPDKKLWPIPQDEFYRNPGLGDQNPGYPLY
ncbi:RagB/SusD family nutrient uptake outer membrane protein [Sinomicrobium soli]|uniref:RagB/SusD family nutrient uptake outer membrane protein n=1 Tax=Sinomicrobium sp. N-1-3-6 TaxID=2219864 RepID=UPI001374EAED|nr:RagB/SusD family nutrient uptake outer membrane protein [Sinomicrobium sp. N-1-3-6]